MLQTLSKMFKVISVHVRGSEGSRAEVSSCPCVWFSSLSVDHAKVRSMGSTMYIDVLFAVGKLNHRYIKSKTRENWTKLTFA